MAQTEVSGMNKPQETPKSGVEKNQLIQMEGYLDDRYVVYDITVKQNKLYYGLINLRTHEFEKCDLIRPLTEKFGIGYYYNDRNPQFMDSSEVEVLRLEAEKITEEKRKERMAAEEHDEQLKVIGRKRLAAIVPKDVKGVIVAELHEDDSDVMTDYFSFSIRKRVILGFSNQGKDLFSELRKYAANFSETAHLAEDNKKYEHREKYAGGYGNYLGKSKYDGWIVLKEKNYRDRESIINIFALTAGDESNICIKSQCSQSVVTGNFIIIGYSDKAIAVFGDTKLIKDQLKAMGGRYNPNLTYEGEKAKGWIFSKGKENQVRSLLKAS